MIELFERFPGMVVLPHVSLGRFPTPAGPLEGLNDRCRLYIKDDGPSGPLYGGNKVRKLEFLLAAARRQGAQEVMTFGVAGSNHALATALYAEQQGLRCISVLTPQTNARYVARNLLVALTTNAELHHFDSEDDAARGARELREQRKRDDLPAPMVIPGGGSSPLGTVGFVNAAFELAAQIEAGLLPEPDRIYVALGTMGTAAGLLLGLRASGLKSRLVPIRVVRESIANGPGMQRLYEETNRLLHETDHSFPLIPFGLDGIRDDQYGQKYAVFTEAGVAARRRVESACGLALEGTYTSKAMAALLADADGGALDGQDVLFWNTYNGVDLAERIAGLDYRRLPAPFHTYFERPVQPLDR